VPQFAAHEVSADRAKSSGMTGMTNSKTTQIGLATLALASIVGCLWLLRSPLLSSAHEDATSLRDSNEQETGRFFIPANSRHQSPDTRTLSMDETRVGLDELRTQTDATQRTLDPLKGIDAFGQLQRIGESEHCSGVVFVFINTDCPIANASIPKLNQLHDEYGDRIEFYGVYPSSTSRRAAREHVREYSIELPVLVDATEELQQRFGATHSPHAFLLNTQFQTIYQGAIDDHFPSLGKRRSEPKTHYLRNAIVSFVGGKSIQLSQTDPIGCRISPSIASTIASQQDPIRRSRDLVSENNPATDKSPLDQTSAHFTFARHVAPIIFGNCATCHQPKAVAPFSLLTYEDVVLHSAQIRVAIEYRLMPPWKPRHGYGEFRDTQLLSQKEIDTVISWIDSGMEFGVPSVSNLGARNETTQLPEPLISKDGWQLGSPDLVLEVDRPFAIKPAGPDVYQYFVIPTNLLEDRLVAAVEYQPGNARVVHHASFRYDDAGNARRLDAQFPGPGYQRFGGWGFQTGGTLGGWAMGVSPRRMPKGFGRPMKAGSDFIIQTHYHPSGKHETDQAKVGIHFAPRSTRRRIGELFVANMNLHIPPNKKKHVHLARYQLPHDVTLHSVLPHAHMLAKEIRAWFVKSANSSHIDDANVQEVPLIYINDWDFNWQGDYVFRKPIELRKGDTICVEVTFDNTTSNPLNPNQLPQWVHWGEDSAQEMAVCFFDVTAKDEAQLDLLIQHNRLYIDKQTTAPIRNSNR
jgi:hypothetical protein